MAVLQTDSALHLVSFNGKPALIPDNQINSIRQILSEKNRIEEFDYFKDGQKVEVVRGPLKGIRGIIQNVKDRKRLIVSVDVLQKSISIDIGIDKIRVLD